MTWDDSKSTAVDPDNPDANEQVTADEWNQHVEDGHWPADELNQGMDAGDPVLRDPVTNDLVLRWDRDAGSWVMSSLSTDEAQINTEVTWPDGNTTTRSPGIWEEIEREEYEGSDTNGDVIEWNGLDGSQFDYRIVLLERFAASDSSISFHIDDMSNSHYAYRRGDGTTANGQDQITIVSSDTWAEGKAVCGLYLSRNKIGFRNRIWPSAFNEISEYALEGGQQEQTDDFDLNKITVDVGYVARGQIVALERRAKA